VPSAKSTDDDADGSAPSAKEGAGDPISAAADDAEPVPMSLDRDASDRSFDRQLAHLGLLDDAAPLFREGASVPGVGVLLALPCLVESGLFRISRKLYGEIGPAFYGLRADLRRFSRELAENAEHHLGTRPDWVAIDGSAQSFVVVEKPLI
jgi:hypothetical protein